MTERAIVCEINNSKVRVMIEHDCQEACLHCSQKDKKESLLVYNKSHLVLKPGDKVEIYAAPAKTILAGFLVFIVPLLLFIAFYFAGHLLFKSRDDLIPFLCGISGIVFGFLLNVGIKLIRRQEELPEITKVYSD